MISRTPEVENAIRRRAQQLYEQRGRALGHEVEDWLQAESEVLRPADFPPAPAYLQVRLNGVVYTGEYDRNHCGGYVPGEISRNAQVELRFAGEKMFLKRGNGVELETRIVAQSPLQA